jgi:hypothetical protein
MSYAISNFVIWLQFFYVEDSEIKQKYAIFLIFFVLH